MTTPEALVAREPPRFMPGEQVVLKGYLDGWRWTVEDAVIGRPHVRHGSHKRGKPTWFYRLSAVRPHDGKTVGQWLWQFQLRPVPEQGQ
jgi:hypothetical protein